MVSLLPWKIWFLWNTERAWKGGERGEGKVVLQKYLKFCLFLAPFAPYKFMLLLLPWFFNSLLLTWERDNVKGGKLKNLQFLHLYCTFLLSFLQFYALVVSMKNVFWWHTWEHQKVGKWGVGKVVLQKYLKWCLLLAPFAPSLLCFLYFREQGARSKVLCINFCKNTITFPTFPTKCIL